jgi:hypothetical protein
VTITRLEVLFDAPHATPGKRIEVELVAGHRHGCKRDAHPEVRRIACVASAEWPGRYRGVVDVHLGPLSDRHHDLVGALRFHPSHGPIHDLFLVCDYEARERHLPRPFTDRGGPDHHRH